MCIRPFQNSDVGEEGRGWTERPVWDRKDLVSLSKINSALYTVENVHRVSKVSHTSRLGPLCTLRLHYGDAIRQQKAGGWSKELRR